MKFFSSRIYILQFLPKFLPKRYHFYKGQLKLKLKGIQNIGSYILSKNQLWGATDLLLACKPVQQRAITVHVAILTLQACLVSPTRHLNPPTGKTKEIQDTEKWARTNPHTKIGWNNFFTLSLMYYI